jgi:uncharacterized repeat protein (TIGR01451 family)
VANNTNTNFTVSGLSQGLQNWSVSCTDLAGNIGISSSRNFTIDTTSPLWSNLQVNATPVYWNQTVSFNASWTDAAQLAGYIFSTNQSGTWVNSSFTAFSGTSNVSHNISTITASPGTTVGWYFWANDSAGNSNQTTIQTFVVQNRSTTVIFNLNQTNYPQAQPVGTGYDVYVPFQVAYLDSMTGQPITGASCNVTNDETSDVVTLDYNSTTGNYTGQLVTSNLYSQAIFYITCSQSDYSPASNSTSATVTYYNYLWSWTNNSYGSQNYYDIYWLRKPPPSGPIVNLTLNLTVTSGSNLVREFYFYNTGVNGTFSRTLNFQGLRFIRLNVSINNTICQPYLLDSIRDFNLNDVYQENASETPPQSIPANTSTLLQYNDTQNVTVDVGYYLTMSYYLNCSGPASLSTSMFFNDSTLQPNFESPDSQPYYLAITYTRFNYPANYAIGPNQTLNVTRNWVIAFNNTGNTSLPYYFQFLPQILSQYPNSNIPGSIYVYNSTGQLWASDNASAGASNVASGLSDNSIVWETENLTAGAETQENLTRGVLNAIRDNETLVSTNASQTIWNISVYDVFIPQVTIFNVTVFTNYSTYGVPNSYRFSVNLTNASGTFVITNQTTINTSAQTLTFPLLNLGPVEFTVTATSTTPPNITFVSPTPANGTAINANWTYINVTSNETLTAAYLDWNGTNESMSGSGANWFLNQIGLPDGIYTYMVYGNDTYGNVGVSQTRTVIIHTVPPLVILVSPANNSFFNATTSTFNFTATSTLNAALNCSIYINGVLNQFNSSVANNTNTNFTVSGLGQGLQNWSVSCTDLANNTGTSTTRNFTIDTTAPSIQFVSPVNGAYINSTSPTFTFNFTSTLSPTANCSIYIDGVLNQTNSSVANNTNTNFTVSGLSQGLQNWSVSCTDLAGNTNTTSSRNFTIDTIAPAIQFVSPANGAYLNSNSTTFTFNFTSTSSPAANCSIYVDGILNQTNSSVANNTNTNFTISGLANGLQNWSVSCTDLAGNTNTSASRNFTMETGPPAITFVSPTPANDTAINVNWTYVNITSNETLTAAYLEWNGTNVSMSGSGTNWFLNQTGLSNGAYTYKVYGNDSYGNVGVSQTMTVIVNTMLPVLSLVSPANSAFFNTNSITFTFNFTSAFSATANCSIYVDGVLNQTNSSVANNTNTNLTVSGLSNGLHNWSVSCTDLANNTGTSSTSNFTIGTAAPIIQFVSPANNAYFNTISQTFTFNFTSTVSSTANCSLYIDGIFNQANSSVANNTNTNFTVSGLGQGLYNWSINCTDLANNTGASSASNFTIDTTAPVVTLSSPANSSVVNTSIVMLNFTAVDALSPTLNCTLVLDNATAATNSSVLNNTLTTFSVNVGQLNHNWSVECTDLAGNTGTSQTWKFHLDSDVPAVTLASPLNNSIFNVSNVSFNFTMVEDSNASCALSIDGILNQTNSNASNTTVNTFNVSYIPYGVHNWSVSCTDEGDLTGYGPVYAFTINTIPPAVVLVSPPNASATTNSTLTFDFIATDNFSATLNCSIFLNGTLNMTNSSTLNSTLTAFIISGIAPGNYAWNVTCTDDANNTDASGTQGFQVYYSNVSALKLVQATGQPSPGGTVEYNLTVNDTGNVPFNVTALDTLPAGLTFLSASPSASVSGQSASWNFTLSPGGSEVLFLNATPDTGTVNASNSSLTLSNVLNVTGYDPYGGTAMAGSTANVTIYYANVSILGIVQLSAQSSPGGIVEFSLAVNNTGNVSLDPTQLIDILPSGLTLLDASPNPDIVAGQMVSWNNIASLAPGANTTVYLNATVDSGVVNATTQQLNLTNCVNAIGSPPNGGAVSTAGCANVTVYYANVSLVKLDITPLPPSPGGNVQWQMNISNAGDVALDAVALTDVLPAGFQYSGAVPAPNSVSPDNLTVSWNGLGSLPVGSSVLVLLNSTVGAAVANGTYVNTATVTASPPNGNPATATDSASVGIFAPAINAIKTVQSPVLLTGQNATFSLNLTNTGSVSITVSAVDDLPTGITFLRASVPPTNVVGQVVTWANLALLTPGESTLLTYDTNATIPGTYQNNMTATGVPANGNNVSGSDYATFQVYNSLPAPVPPVSGGNHASTPPLSVAVTSSCNGSVVTVTGDGNAVAGARVVINGISIYYTDQSGRAYFSGCGGTASVYASADGYLPADVPAQLVACSMCAAQPPPQQLPGCASDAACAADEACTGGACTLVSGTCGYASDHVWVPYECCADSDCGSGQVCANHSCISSPSVPECTADSQCAGTQACINGNCTSISACGVVANHTVVQPWQCGPSPACHPCAGGASCIGNSCVSGNLTAPAQVSAGSNTTITALINGKICADCELMISPPSGNAFTAATDANGNFVLPASASGTYTIALSKDGVLLSTLTINSLAGPAPSQQPLSSQNAFMNAAPYCLGLVVLLVILLVLFLLWRRRRKKKTGKDYASRALPAGIPK